MFLTVYARTVVALLYDQCVFMSAHLFSHLGNNMLLVYLKHRHGVI